MRIIYYLLTGLILLSGRPAMAPGVVEDQAQMEFDFHLDQAELD